MEEKLTPSQWVEHLGRELSPVTLQEFMAGCLSRMLSAQIEAVQAARHTEGMMQRALEGTQPTPPRTAELKEGGHEV